MSSQSVDNKPHFRNAEYEPFGTVGYTVFEDYDTGWKYKVFGEFLKLVGLKLL